MIGYSGNLISFLSVSTYSNPIDSIREMLDVGITVLTVEPTFADKVSGHEIPRYRELKFEFVGSLEAMWKGLDKETAALESKDFLEYSNRQRFTDK